MRPRCVLLYVPGNSPSLIQSSMVAGADVVVLDLEDAVLPSEKDAARELVSEAIRHLPWGEVDLAVRVNPISSLDGLRDIEAAVTAGARLLRVPKVESAEQLVYVDALLETLEQRLGLSRGSVRVIASIESARGLLALTALSLASDRLDAYSLGGEDLTADMGSKRSREGDELTYARTALVCAARATGIGAIDTVYAHVDDEQGLFYDAQRACLLGFDGKSVISPRQIPVVRRAFSPSPEEVADAERLIESARRAAEAGLGVVSVAGKMVDAPVIKRAQRVLAMARLVGGGKRYEW